MKLAVKINIAAVVVAALLPLISAQIVSAQVTTSGGDSATIADKDCLEFQGACQYQQQCDKSKPRTPQNIGILNKTCKDPRGVTGHCVAYGVCKGDSAVGSNGKSSGVGDLSSLMSALGSIMKALGGGQSSGGTPSPSSMPTGSQGCTQYYAVSTPSSDPCAYYVPGGNTTGNINLNTNGNTNTGLDLGNSNSSGGDTSGGNPISNLISDLLGGNSDTGTSTGGAGASGNAGTSSSNLSSSTAQGATSLGPTGPGGANGDIRVLPNGATIIISNQNNAGNSVTAGFLGTETSFGNQPSSIVASWCRTRPWASNFLSFIIPATFFDSLCTLRGFQVGDSVQAGGPAQIGGSSNVVIHNPDATTGTTSYVWGSVQTSPPIEANIWAVPPAVSLGGRTTIYWNSKNAASCTETSPDGSFSQNTLSGGSATVPLSGPTVFTISCMGADGSHTTADVTVRLSL